MSLHSKYKTFLSMPLTMRLLSLEALLFQLIVGLVLKVIPFKKIPVLFSNAGHIASDSQLSATRPLHIPEQVKQAIQSTGKFSPWKNKCLVQSLTGRWMLRRRGIYSQLSLGVTLEQDKRMIAHAWLKTADIEIVKKDGDYHELFLF